MLRFTFCSAMLISSWFLFFFRSLALLRLYPLSVVVLRVKALQTSTSDRLRWKNVNFFSRRSILRKTRITGNFSAIARWWIIRCENDKWLRRGREMCDKLCRLQKRMEIFYFYASFIRHAGQLWKATQLLSDCSWIHWVKMIGEDGGDLTEEFRGELRR